MGNEEGKRKKEVSFLVEVSLVIASGKAQNSVTIDDVATYLLI